VFDPSTRPPTVLDALTAPGDVAVWAATVAPGAEVVGPLAVIDPAKVDGVGQIDLLVAYERQIAWLAAAQQRVLAELDGSALDWTGKQSIDYTQEQVGAALRLSPGHAADRLAVGRILVDRLPTTLELLEGGEITYLHAKKLAESVVAFDAKPTGEIEERVLRRAGDQTVGQFAASVRRAVLAADPRRAEQRHADALAERRVVVTPKPDGMAELWAWLPAEGAALVKTVLDSLATVKTPGDGRVIDQRRADALVDVFARVLGDPNLPEHHGHRPAIQVTIAASTLVGCDELPAELEGYGPITAALARRIATDPTGTWRRLLTDPASGHLMEYGRSTYRPPATSPTMSSPETEPACSRTAEGRPDSAILTTARTGAPAVRPANTTCIPYANGTTTPNTTPAGPSPAPTTAATTGPHLPTTPTPSTHPTTADTAEL
jgi:hypothetical protein